VTIAILTLIAATRSATLAVTFDVLFLFFETLHDLVKSGFSHLFVVEGSVFFRLFYARLDIVPGVADPHRGLKMLDPRAKGINSPTLLTISGVLVILATFEYLLAETLEDEFQGVFIDLGCTSISEDNFVEVVKSGFGRNLISLILCRVRVVSEGC
jgi:hypothetical protein